MQTTRHVIEVSDASFESEVLDRSRETPVVVDFWAPWCGPCRTLGPLLERLAAEGNGAFVLAKINVDENPSLSMRYGIQGIPAVKGFREGRVVAEFVGAQPEPNVRRFLKQVVPDETDRILEEARQLLAEHRWPEAEAVFRRALAARPANARTALGLARALIAQGRGCEADMLIEEIAGGPESAEAEALRLLARCVCEAESADGDDLPPIEAHYRRAARLIGRGQFAAGMAGLIEVIRLDKRYRKDEPRRVMLALFQWLGEDDPLTREYRQDLASALF